MVKAQFISKLLKLLYMFKGYLLLHTIWYTIVLMEYKFQQRPKRGIELG